MTGTEIVNTEAETNTIAPKTGDELSKQRESKQYFEILLLDMMRANEISPDEYHKITSQNGATSLQSRKDS